MIWQTKQTKIAGVKLGRGANNIQIIVELKYTVNSPPQEPDDFLATPKTLGRFLASLKSSGSWGREFTVLDI